jgi:hypothetical protein
MLRDETTLIEDSLHNNFMSKMQWEIFALSEQLWHNESHEIERWFSE